MRVALVMSAARMEGRAGSLALLNYFGEFIYICMELAPSESHFSKQIFSCFCSVS